MSLRNDTVSFRFWGYIDDIWTKLQAPVMRYSLPSSTKKRYKVGHPLTKLWIRACYNAQVAAHFTETFPYKVGNPCKTHDVFEFLQNWTENVFSLLKTPCTCMYICIFKEEKNEKRVFTMHNYFDIFLYRYPHWILIFYTDPKWKLYTLFL